MEVVTAINVPLDLVTFALRRERLETVVFSDSSSLGVSQLLVLLVMAMVGIDQVLKFANAVLEVNGSNFGVVQVSVLELVSQLAHEPLVLLLGAVRLSGTVFRSNLFIGAHVGGSTQDHGCGNARWIFGSRQRKGTVEPVTCCQFLTLHRRLKRKLCELGYCGAGGNPIVVERQDVKV